MELPPPLAETIAARLGVRVCRSEPLARHTSFRIGGPADLLVVPETVDELAFVLRAASACGATVTMLGGGSNVLVGDGGVRGVVVKLGRGFARVEWHDGEGGAEVRAGAGAKTFGGGAWRASRTAAPTRARCSRTPPATTPAG